VFARSRPVERTAIVVDELRGCVKTASGWGRKGDMPQLLLERPDLAERPGFLLSIVGLLLLLMAFAALARHR
jgi:hypothetical protein